MRVLENTQNCLLRLQSSVTHPFPSLWYNLQTASVWYELVNTRSLDRCGSDTWMCAAAVSTVAPVITVWRAADSCSGAENKGRATAHAQENIITSLWLSGRGWKAEGITHVHNVFLSNETWNKNKEQNKYLKGCKAAFYLDVEMS